MLGADLQMAKVTFRLGKEILSSDGGLYGMQTPLATKHAFNGWADKFLATPATGLVDSWLGVSTKLGKFGLTAFFHDFEADFGGSDYGTEFNLVVSAKLTEHYTLGLKLADYKSEGFSNDTTKGWLWFELVL